MDIEPLYLTSHDIEILKAKKKEIGRGSDGVVYQSSQKDLLYKIYYKDYEQPEIILPSNYQRILDDEGVNIADNKQIFRESKGQSKYKINYYNQEGVKLGGIQAVYEAIKRQEKITRTQLQRKPIFVDHHFQGTVLYHHRFVGSISYLKMFPISLQTHILKELLLSVKELLENNIYPIDIGVKPDGVKNMNVLLSFFPKLSPVIIDIDGKSAIYTEKENQFYHDQSLKTYKSLMNFILFDFDTAKLEELDYDYQRKRLINRNIPSEYLDSILNYDEVIPIDSLNEFLDEISKTKKKKKRKKEITKS